MANIVSVSGVGTRGGAGMQSGSGDWRGGVDVRFAAEPWETQPALSGTIVLEFADHVPSRFLPAGGWAALVPTVEGNTVSLAWTCQAAPQAGTTASLEYDH